MGRRPKVTRDEVLTAARAAFAERGFDATTLSAIAARLGISAAALLRHAPTKEALFATAMTAGGPGDIRPPFDFLTELDGSEDPVPVLREIGLRFVPFIEQKLDEQVARWMRAKAGDEPPAGPGHGEVGPFGIFRAMFNAPTAVSGLVDASSHV